MHRVVQDEREPQIDPRLFPEEVPSGRRPFEFEGKDVVFVSARVHPGETPASFVFQGILRYNRSEEFTLFSLEYVQRHGSYIFVLNNL